MTATEMLDADGLTMLADTVRRFVEREIAPLEEDLRRDGALGIPPDIRADLQRKARTAGLWCFSTPAEFGGAGLSASQLVVVLEQAVRHTYSLPDAGDGAFGYDPPNFLLGADERQRERYLLPAVESGMQCFVAITEPSGGSDPARSISTRAERGPGGWTLTGRKMFISRVGESDYGVVLARTGPGRGGISAFIVEKSTPGFSYRPVSVIRDHGTFEVVLDGVTVPAENLLGAEGAGFALAKNWLAKGRLGIAARSIGVAQLAVEMAITYAKDRSTFGQPLAGRQAVQWMIADSHVELHAARLVIRESAAALDAGVEASGLSSAMAKLVGTETAFRVLDRVIQIFGGMGLCREMPLEHWYRALRVNRIVEGASEVQRMLIARELLGTR
jgi:acyl-CoA dehydrogenase